MQAELGDIVYVELPEAGSEVEKGNNFGVVESVKVLIPSCASSPSSRLSSMFATLLVHGAVRSLGSESSPLFR